MLRSCDDRQYTFRRLIMKYLAFLPLLLTIFLILRCAAVLSARKKPDWRSAVYLPNALFWFGLLGNIFVIPSAVLLWQEDTAHIWFTALCLLGWSLELAYVNCWVRFDEQGFTHHSFFGKTCTFSYMDVTGIRRGDEGDIRLYCEKRMIFLDNMSVNLDQFMHRVDRKSKRLRDLSGTGWNPYRHKVPGGMSIFIALMAFLLLITVYLVIIVYGCLEPPESEASTTREELVFVSGELLDGDVVRLTSEQGDNYQIGGYFELPVAPESLWDGKTVYTVWSAGKNPTWIYQLRAGNQMVMSFQDQNEAERANARESLPLMLILWIAGLLFVLSSFLVGRHPEHFSPRVRKWFFRDL